jgi:hypothetical protein
MNDDPNNILVIYVYNILNQIKIWTNFYITGAIFT